MLPCYVVWIATDGMVCCICSSSYQRVGSVMVYLSADVYVYVYVYVAIICTTSCGGGLHAMWCCVDSYEVYALYV